MTKGYLSLVLHAHLPFVRNIENDDHLEEDWFYEAITESYLPILNMFEALKKDELPFAITITMSPTLFSMLRDPLLIERYIKRLDRLIKLSNKEISRVADNPAFLHLARMYNWRYKTSKELFMNRYDCDLVSQFKRLSDERYLEIIPTAATHGYIMLLSVDDKAAIAQINIGIDIYESIFEQSPKGFWLPECGYKPGYEKILRDRNVDYSILEAHGILNGSPAPVYGIYAPVMTDSGLAFFGRDLESSKEVWSSKEGYPGDHSYREFYRDIGYELDYEYIKDYIQPTGERKQTGIKYYKITGQSEEKEIYNPEEGVDRAATHAKDFLKKRIERIDKVSELTGIKPIITACYDAELFGHWWYEGPDFLNFLIREVRLHSDEIELISPSRYLDKADSLQRIKPSLSSWGDGGYSAVWLDESNDFIYRDLHIGLDRMVSAANMLSGTKDLKTIRALNQMARELLLSQASDWAFIIKSNTSRDYAKDRIYTHLGNFNTLYDQVVNDRIDPELLERLELENPIFPEISYESFNFE